MKILKSIKVIAALVLTLTTAFLLPLNTAAAESENKYVSEVYVAYGKDAEAAKKTLSDKGFTPVEGNLNDGGKTYTMMGYKTTSNAQEALTDISAMNMRGGYSVEKYQNFLKNQKTQIADFLNDFMSVVKEYRANLKAGKTKAKVVHDLLNYYIDDDTGKKMGDLLNSNTLQDKVGIQKSINANNPDKLPDLITILMQGNSQIVKSMEYLLSMATDTADNGWIDRFAALDYDKLLDNVEKERPELNTESKRKQYIDNLYGQTAEGLSLETAGLRGKIKDYESAGIKIETATKEDINKTFGDVEKDPNAALKMQSWMSIGMVYDGLNNYEGGRFKKGELLKFFLDETDTDDERFYPMAAAFSEGQRCGLTLINLENMIRYSFADEAGWKKMAEERKSVLDTNDNLSIYQNVDRNIYKDDGSVALTDAAQRAENVSSLTAGSSVSQMDTLSKILALSWVGSGVSLISAIITRARFNTKLDEFARLYVEFKNYSSFETHRGIWHDTLTSTVFNSNDLDAYRYTVKEIYQTDPALAAKLTSTHFSVVLSQLFTFLTIVLAITGTVLTIIDLCRDTSVEQLPIPGYLVDNRTGSDGQSSSVNYRAVECNRTEYFGADYKRQKGNCADINADEGKQWLTLYVSKDKTVGSPITTDILVLNKKDAPDNYDGDVSIIGEKGAVNLASNAFKKYSTLSASWQTITGSKTVYVFYKTDPKALPSGEPESGDSGASTFNGFTAAIFGCGGLVLGGILGAVIAVLISKNRRKKETA